MIFIFLTSLYTLSKHPITINRHKYQKINKIMNKTSLRPTRNASRITVDPLLLLFVYNFIIFPQK